MGSKWTVVMGLALAISGCVSQAPEPLVQIEIREKLVPQRCIRAEDLPPKPKYKAGSGPYLGGGESAKVMLSDFEAAKAYGSSMDTLLVGCVVEAARATN